MEPMSKKRSKHYCNRALGSHARRQLDEKFVTEFLPSKEAQAQVLQYEV